MFMVLLRSVIRATILSKAPTPHLQQGSGVASVGGNPWQISGRTLIRFTSLLPFSDTRQQHFRRQDFNSGYHTTPPGGNNIERLTAASVRTTRKHLRRHSWVLAGRNNNNNNWGLSRDTHTPAASLMSIRMTETVFNVNFRRLN